MVVAEALGTSNTSRVKDLFPNDGNEVAAPCPVLAFLTQRALGRSRDTLLSCFPVEPTGLLVRVGVLQRHGGSTGQPGERATAEH